MESLRGGDAVNARHDQVHQHHFRMRADRFKGFLTVASFADHLQVRLTFEQRTEPLAHAVEAGRHILCQPGGQGSLADTAHAEDRCQATALVQHPAAQERELLGAADEISGVWRFSPILRALHGTNATERAIACRGRGRGRRSTAVSSSANHTSSHGVHAWGLSLHRGPQLARIRRLPPLCQTTRLN